MKEKLQMTLQKYKESSQTIMNNHMPKKNGQPRKNGQIVRKEQSPKTELGREKKKNS